MNRREFLNQSAIFAMLPYLGLNNFVLQRVWAEAKRANKTLLIIFQRGAVDGLSMVSPIGDANFNKDLRPNIRIAPEQMLKLDSYFSMHPALAGLKTLWDKNLLSVIHQVGSPSGSRSHFDAQDYFESGTPDYKGTEDGLLARAGRLLKQPQAAKISSLSVQAGLPRLLVGDKQPLTFNDLNQFSIKGLGAVQSSARGFENFFDMALDEVLNGSSKNSISVLNDFERAKKVPVLNGFPKGKLALHLKDMVRVIKAGIYVPFMVTEAGGWDTHSNQGNDKGALANRLKEFSEAILAFVNELGPKIEDVTILTVTEFGRTVKENGSRGTDHGHGSCYFLINGGVKSKTIHANWKELKSENLFEGRDLPVTTDFRDVFSNIFESQFGIADKKTLFPDYKIKQNLKLYV